MRGNVNPTAVRVENGVVSAQDGRRLGYGEMVRDDPKLLVRDVSHLARPKAPDSYRIVGNSAPRIDLPDMVMARGIYLQDMRMPGMVFGRVVRPPSAGAELQSIDEAVVGSLPGVLAVVRLSSFLGLVADGEGQASRAAEALRRGARWKSVGPGRPHDDGIAQGLGRVARHDMIAQE